MYHYIYTDKPKYYMCEISVGLCLAGDLPYRNSSDGDRDLDILIQPDY
jgi:hypothetical protein